MSMFDAMPDVTLDDDSDGGVASEISPRRAAYRGHAFRAMQKQAAQMQRRVAKRDGDMELSVGAVVQLGLADVDRTKIDPRNLTCVVVECVRMGEKEEELKYRLAASHAVLQGLYTRPYLQQLRATPELMGLEGVLENWKNMRVLSARATSNASSLVGGQGMVRCNCLGNCLQGKCKCLKAGRLCNSRCHKGSKRCKNC